MEVEIVEIKEEEKEVLLNLIEKYLYEFSQWEKTDVNVEGNYGYEYCCLGYYGSMRIRII